jgi:hypothetical protein
MALKEKAETPANGSIAVSNALCYTFLYLEIERRVLWERKPRGI